MSIEKRRERIKQIIEEVEVNTQGELARLLTNEGFSVTQATVSRDIKELGLPMGFKLEFRGWIVIVEPCTKGPFWIAPLME